MRGSMIGRRVIMSYTDPRDGRDITIFKDSTDYWVMDEASATVYPIEVVRG